MESYCTKSCGECTRREEFGCPGCKNGPGMYPCKCEIAACCHAKDHEDCSTCTRNSTCARFRRKERIPVERKQEQDAAEEEEIHNREKAGHLAKYMKILLWLVFPRIFAALLSDIPAGEPLIFPILGETLSLAVTVVYGTALLKMSPYSEDYSKSGVVRLIVGGMTFIMFLLFGVDDKPE